MKRVLQLTIGETLRGAEKLELDWLKNIDNHIKFDFLAVNDGVFKDYLDEIEKLGGKVYNLNVKYDTFKNKIIYGNRLYRFLKKITMT